MVFDKDIHSLILDNYPKKPSLVYLITCAPLAYLPGRE